MRKKKQIDCVKKLQKLTIFKFQDESAGDFKGLLCFVGGMKPATPPHGTSGTMYKIITEEGYADWMHESELDGIDPKTIRQYDPDHDVDFYGLCG